MKQIFRFGSLLLVLLSCASPLFAQTEISDADNDTQVETERTADEDIIWFRTEGVDRARLLNTRLEFLNNGRSVFIGAGAGANDDGTNNENVFIGNDAGTANTSGAGNVALGRNSLKTNSTGLGNMGIGPSSLLNNLSGNYNAAIGNAALLSNTTGDRNAGIGFSALRFTTTGGNNLGIGSQSGYFNTVGNRNINLGTQANYYNEEGENNVIIGYQAGRGTALHNKSNNIFIGNQAGYNETGSDRLYIENSNSATPLIYGEFDNDLLQINGSLLLRDGFTDADMDTKIQVEESVDDDIIRFDIEGAEVMAIGKNRLQLNQDGGNTLIGFDAGKNNTISAGPTGVQNTFLGFRAGHVNTSGNANTYIGYDAAFSNITGINNTFLGAQAGAFSTGSDNVHIGYQAGYFNTADNRLFIENSNSNEPLIYGEFDNDLLTVNGRTTINATSNTSTLYVTDSTTSTSQGVIYAENTDTGASDKRAVRGLSNPTDGYGYGGQFEGGWRGVYGIGAGGDYNGTVVGVYGTANGGSLSNRVGVYGVASGGAEAWGGYFPTKVYATELRVGNVGEAVGYKLVVDGKAICEELKIQNSTAWPDYVFASEYDLKPLEEVEAFIQKNKHLPNIPSESEIADADGYHIGEMQNKTIEKVEELTLYAIDANKRIKDLEAVNAALVKQNAEMKAMMESILKKLEK